MNHTNLIKKIKHTLYIKKIIAILKGLNKPKTNNRKDVLMKTQIQKLFWKIHIKSSNLKKLYKK